MMDLERRSMSPRPDMDSPGWGMEGRFSPGPDIKGRLLPMTDLPGLVVDDAFMLPPPAYELTRRLARIDWGGPN